MEISAPIMVGRNSDHDFIFCPKNNNFSKIVEFIYKNTQLK